MNYSPLRPVKDGLIFAEELEKDGLDPQSDDFQGAIMFFLGEETDEHCKCGMTLKRFETGGRMCTPCQEAYEAQGTLPEGTEASRIATMSKIGVPPQYRHCTLAAWEEKIGGQVPEKLDGWLTFHSPNNLVIYGPDRGTGKTHLATAALYSRYSGGKGSCFWKSAVQLARDLFDERNTPDSEALKKSSRVGCLLIDDYGAENRLTFNAKESISAVLDLRWQNKLPTIITTNMTPEQMVAYDESQASRLLSGVIVQREGRDQRWMSR